MDTTAVSAVAEQKTPKKAWLMFLLVYLCGVAAPMTQFKTPPLASWIIPAFQLDGMSFGLQMSAIGITGLVLAFPAAYICRSLGAKRTVVLATACLVVGNFGGTIVGSFEGLMVTRLLEGVGLGLVGVVGPTCVAVWFPEKTKGVAMGLWATWVPLAMTLIFAIAPSIAQTVSWQGVFYFCGGFSLVALVLFAAFFKMPEGDAGDFMVAGSAKETLRLMKNKNIWLLGIIMLIFMFIGTGAINTYYNTFLMDVHGYNDVDAAAMVSILTAIGIVAGPVAGIVYDRFRPSKKRFILMLSFVAYLIACVLGFPAAGAGAAMGIWTMVIAGGLGCGVGAGTIRPLAPLCMGGGAMGAAISMAIIQFMQNLGAALGSPAFAAAYEGIGWSGAGYILGGLCVVAIVLAFFINPEKGAGKAAAARGESSPEEA